MNMACGGSFLQESEQGSLFWRTLLNLWKYLSHFLFAGRCPFSWVKVRENGGRIGFLYIDFQISFLFHPKHSQLSLAFWSSEHLWASVGKIKSHFCSFPDNAYTGCELLKCLYCFSISFLSSEVLLLFVCLFHIFYLLMTFTLCYVYVCISFRIIY